MNLKKQGPDNSRLDPIFYADATEECDGIDNNCDSNIDEGFDADTDGYTICEGDCDDSDSTINPGITEILYNCIDNDCNEATPYDDLDGDGYVLAEDCNDNNSTIYPNAPEIKHDGLDQDCNGYDLSIDIIKAEYKGKKDKLRVEATSAIGELANLNLEGYGPMVYSK